MLTNAAPEYSEAAASKATAGRGTRYSSPIRLAGPFFTHVLTPRPLLTSTECQGRTTLLRGGISKHVSRPEYDSASIRRLRCVLV